MSLDDLARLLCQSRGSLSIVIYLRRTLVLGQFPYQAIWKLLQTSWEQKRMLSFQIDGAKEENSDFARARTGDLQCVRLT
jgi:hypothetical protein